MKNFDFLNLKFQPEVKDSPRLDLTSENLAKAYESLLFSYDGRNEDKGPNRSDWVDEINKWIGVPLGSPYCLSSLLFNLRRLEAQFAIRFDLADLAGTQLFWLATKNEYRLKEPKNFCIGIFRSKADPTKGHAVYCKTGAIKSIFETFEFNTNSSGSREGGTVMSTKRNTNGSDSLTLLGFVDLSKCWKPVKG